jgi:hypothetical protein
MAYARLSRQDEAKKFPVRLREALADPEHKTEAESQTLLREAEAVTEGKRTGENKNSTRPVAGACASERLRLGRKPGKR